MAAPVTHPLGAQLSATFTQVPAPCLDAVQGLCRGTWGAVTHAASLRPGRPGASMEGREDSGSSGEAGADSGPWGDTRSRLCALETGNGPNAAVTAGPEPAFSLGHGRPAEEA